MADLPGDVVPAGVHHNPGGSLRLEENRPGGLPEPQETEAEVDLPGQGEGREVPQLDPPQLHLRATLGLLVLRDIRTELQQESGQKDACQTK